LIVLVEGQPRIDKKLIAAYIHTSIASFLILKAKWRLLFNFHKKDIKVHHPVGKIGVSVSLSSFLGN
jgi:hypothetical protein